MSKCNFTGYQQQGAQNDDDDDCNSGGLEILSCSSSAVLCARTEILRGLCTEFVRDDDEILIRLFH